MTDSRQKRVSKDAWTVPERKKRGWKRDRVTKADVTETSTSVQSFTLKMKATPYTAVTKPASAAVAGFILYPEGQPVGLRMAAAVQA
jgi:hypothetical protein